MAVAASFFISVLTIYFISTLKRVSISCSVPPPSLSLFLAVSAVLAIRYPHVTRSEKVCK